MTTFFMFGKYSAESLKKISTDRTRKAIGAVQKLGGQVKSVYALLGDSDLVFIVNLPDAAKATLASIALTRLTGISFKTSTATPIDEFDRMFNQYK